MPARTYLIKSHQSGPSACANSYAIGKPIETRHCIIEGQCVRCGAIAAIGELTKECAGRKLPKKIFGLIAAGLVDMIDGQWVNVNPQKHNTGRAKR